MRRRADPAAGTDQGELGAGLPHPVPAVLSLGDRGPEVRAAQEALNRGGAGSGPGRRFRPCHHGRRDGFPGPAGAGRRRRGGATDQGRAGARVIGRLPVGGGVRAGGNPGGRGRRRRQPLHEPGCAGLPAATGRDPGALRRTRPGSGRVPRPRGPSPLCRQRRRALLDSIWRPWAKPGRARVRSPATRRWVTSRTWPGPPWPSGAWTGRAARGH